MYRFKRLGFSLPELLIAITIMAILATLAIVDFSHTQRNARDGRRKSDVQAISAAITQYTSATGSSFIRYPKKQNPNDTCAVPAILNPESFSPDLTPASGALCTGAQGRSFGKMNLTDGQTDSYGPYRSRVYTQYSMMDALHDGGYLASRASEPSSPAGNHTDPTVKDYILIRACSNGWENFGRNGAIFAVWAGLENTPSTLDIANSAVLAGGSKAGPVTQGAGYVYDFGAMSSEYTAGTYSTLGYAAGSIPTKADAFGSCASS